MAAMKQRSTMRPAKQDDPSEKRAPTLADWFMFDHDRFTWVPNKVHDGVINRLRLARKFVLDENATRRIAEVIRDIPDLIAREHLFARPPFDVTWIEFPADIMDETINLKDYEGDPQRRLKGLWNA